jgi:hypothetical protein
MSGGQISNICVSGSPKALYKISPPNNKMVVVNCNLSFHLKRDVGGRFNQIMCA